MIALMIVVADERPQGRRAGSSFSTRCGSSAFDFALSLCMTRHAARMPHAFILKIVR